MEHNAEIQQLFQGMSKQEQANFIEGISEAEAGKLADALSGAQQQPAKVGAYFDAALASDPSSREARLAGAGRFFTNVGRGAQQLFSSPQRSQEIASQTAEEDALIAAMQAREASAVPQAPQQYNLGQGLAGLSTAALPLGLPANIGARTGLGALMTRLGVSGGIAGGLNTLQTTVPEGEGQNLPWYSPNAETKLGQFGKGAVLGSVLQGAAEGARQIAPVNFYLKNKIEKFMTDPKYAPQKEAFDKFIEAKGNIAETAPSQVFGSPRLAGIEGNVARSGEYADQALNIATKAQRKSLGKLTDVISNMGEDVSSKTGDYLLRRAQYAAEADVKAVRHAEAFIDYGNAKKAVAMITGSPKSPIVGSNSLVDEMDNLAAEFANKGNFKTAAALKKHAGQLLNNVRSIDDAIQLRSGFNELKAGESGGYALPKDEVYGLGRRLSDAVTQDLLVAGEGIGAPQISGLLKKANDNYAKNSRNIEDIQSTVLGKVLNARNKQPIEAFSEAMDKAAPTQLAKQMRVLESVSPQFAGQARKLYLERMMQRSQLGPEAMATEINATLQGRDIAVNIGSFSKDLRNEDVLKILFKSPADRAVVKNIASGLERLADRAGQAGASTSLQTETMQAAHSAVTGNPGFVARFLTGVVFKKAMYGALFTPEGRRALYQFTRPDPRNAAAGAIALERILNSSPQTAAEQPAEPAQQP